jgi:Zn-dependent protease
MLRSLKIGSAFGVPVLIHWTFLTIPLLVLWMHGFGSWFRLGFLTVVVLAVFFCILLHEFGHVLMARYFGIRTRSVTLYPIGGVARLESLSEAPHEELLIAIAGPAVNVAIAILLTPFVIAGAVTRAISIGEAINVSPGDGAWPLIATGLFLLWASNIGLVLFNLIPAFPMDGGRVLRSLLSLGLGFPKATEVAVWIGVGMAGLLAIVGMTVPGQFMLVILAAFVALAGQMELQFVRRREEMRRIRREYGRYGIVDLPLGQEPTRRPMEVFPPRTAEPRPGPRPVSVPPPPQLVFFLRAVEIPDPPRN